MLIVKCKKKEGKRREERQNDRKTEKKEIERKKIDRWKEKIERKRHTSGTLYLKKTLPQPNSQTFRDTTPL